MTTLNILPKEKNTTMRRFNPLSVTQTVVPNNLKTVRSFRKKTLRHLFICFGVIGLLIAPLQAGIDSDMKGFFDAMGASSNITKGGAYRDQSGGYYSGGSVFVRSPTRNIQLLNVTPPSFSMNCGSMDFIAGGFSVLSSQQLMTALQGIGRSAAAYALQLGLQTVTPQVKAAIDQLMAVLQNVNGMTQNSCQAGKLLAAGLLPKNEAMMKDLCKSKGMSLRQLEDWAGLDKGCSTTGTDFADRQVPGFEDVLAGEFNVAWKALQKNAFLKSDTQLAHLMMSISGSIISRKAAGGKYQKSHLPSLMTNQNLIDALIQGGVPAEVYTCDNKAEDKCLNPGKGQITLSQERALHGKVHTLLEGLSHKVRYDTPISAEEMAFVNSTSLPVMAMLAVEGAFRSDGAPVKTTAMAEAISYDLLLRYFSGILELVSENLRDLEQVQVDGSVIDMFRQDIREAQHTLADKRNGIYQQMITQLNMIQHTEQIENKLYQTFTSSQGDYR